MAIIKKIKKLRFDEDIEKREPLCTVCGNVNWFSCYETYKVFSKT